MEFCARIDFDLLNGKIFSRQLSWGSFSKETEDKDISLKFSKIGLNTQYAISRKRLQRLEMYYRRNPDTTGDDGTIPLS